MLENNLAQSWMDFQKKVFQSLADSMTTGGQSESKTNTHLFAQSMQPFHQALQNWVDFANNTYEKNLKQLGESSPLYKETIEKYAGINSFNNGLKKFWEDLNASITDKESSISNFYTKWLEEYSRLVSNQLLLFLPEDAKQLFDKTIDIYQASYSTGHDFFAPWMEQAESMRELLTKSAFGDQDAYIEFLKLWQTTFSSSFGRVFNIPQFLANPEQIQKQMNSINALIAFINTLNEYMAVLVKKSQDTLDKMIKDYQAMVIDGTHPKSYKEFYEFWWKQNESAYLQLFGTEEFARLIGQVLDAGVSFKRKYDDMLEKQLEFLPYPSKTDMDSVYKTLDSLKREIRALKKEVAALKPKEKASTGKDKPAVKEG